MDAKKPGLPFFTIVVAVTPLFGAMFMIAFAISEYFNIMTISTVILLLLIAWMPMLLLMFVAEFGGTSFKQLWLLRSYRIKWPYNDLITNRPLLNWLSEHKLEHAISTDGIRFRYKKDAMFF